MFLAYPLQCGFLPSAYLTTPGLLVTGLVTSYFGASVGFESVLMAFWQELQFGGLGLDSISPALRRVIREYRALVTHSAV